MMGRTEAYSGSDCFVMVEVDTSSERDKSIAHREEGIRICESTSRRSSKVSAGLKGIDGAFERT